jgi:hypothetical protein
MEATQVSPSRHRHPAHPPAAAGRGSLGHVLSLAGVGALAGWLPGPGAHSAEPAKARRGRPGPDLDPADRQRAAGKGQAGKQAASTARRASRAVTSVRQLTRHRSRWPRRPVPDANLQRLIARTGLPGRAAGKRSAPNAAWSKSVREVAVEAKGSGGGAVAGGVVGGLIGNQIGKGATRDIATVLGAVGGAYAGNHIEKSVKEAKRYDVIVRFEDGSTRTFSSDTPPAWHSGDRVQASERRLDRRRQPLRRKFGVI